MQIDGLKVNDNEIEVAEAVTDDGEGHKALSSNGEGHRTLFVENANRVVIAKSMETT